MEELKKTNGTQFLYQINHYSCQLISSLTWKLILLTTTKAKISKIYKKIVKIIFKKFPKKNFQFFYVIQILIKYSTWGWHLFAFKCRQSVLHVRQYYCITQTCSKTWCTPSLPHSKGQSSILAWHKLFLFRVVK